MSEIFFTTQRIGLYIQPKANNHWNNIADKTSIFRTMPFEPGKSILDGKVNVGYINTTSQNSIVKEVNRMVQDNYSSLKYLPFSADVSYKFLAPLLWLACQSVVENSNSPYIKTIKPGFIGQDPVIDFPANEGHLVSVGSQFYNPVSGNENDGLILGNALLDELELSFDLLQNGLARNLKASGTFVGTKVVYLEQDGIGFTGNWIAKPTGGYYNMESSRFLSVQIYSPASDPISYTGCIRRFSLSIKNNIFTDCVGLEPQNLKAKPEYSFTIDIPYVPGQTTQIKKKYNRGDRFAIQFSTPGNSSTPGYLKFMAGDGVGANKFYNCVLTAEPEYFEGEYLALRLQGEVLYSNQNSNDPFEITLTDAIQYGV